MNSAIEINHLNYSYPATEERPAHPIFADLNLTVEQGSFTAILGRNGCGKSTLARHCNGILMPCGGKVYVYGMDCADEDKLIAVRRTVGMVFQNPDNQIVANVVEEDVAFGPENLGIAPPMIRKRVDEALKQVGMYEYRTHAPHLLSGGQKQRVCIAGVIAMEPKCIVLDEPTAMLDPKGRREVIETVQKLNREKKITVVLITHHMDEAAAAHRVVVLDGGEIAMDGSPREVLSQVEKLHKLGLASTDSAELCYALRQQGMDVPTDQLSAEDCAQILYEKLKEV